MQYTRLAVIALLALSLLSPARAQDRQCYSIETYTTYLAGQRVIERYVVLTGEQLKAASDYLNAMPPITNNHPATIIVGFGRDPSRGIILTGMEDEVCEWGAFADRSWFEFQFAVFGT